MLDREGGFGRQFLDHELNQIRILAGDIEVRHLLHSLDERSRIVQCLLDLSPLRILLLGSVEQDHDEAADDEDQLRRVRQRLDLLDTADFWNLHGDLRCLLRLLFDHVDQLLLVRQICL